MNENAQHVPLGQTDITLSPIGLGAWQWGDRWVWGFGRHYGEGDIEAAFQQSVDSGVNWVDTAEVYGNGRSERFLGSFLRTNHRQRVLVATKFFPYPWRLRQGDLIRAAQGSLRRLGVDRIDLYQIHQPYSPVPFRRWVRGLAAAQQQGLVRAVGVSNYATAQMLASHEELVRHGLGLSANQVRYSLLDRGPERTGLLEACQRHGITLIAYSPLAQGWLTGKYHAGNLPSGLRRRLPAGWTRERLEELLTELRRLGQAQGGKTPAQVALNWVLAKGAVAIPGAKNRAQALENAGAMGWTLTPDQVRRLDELTRWT